MDRDFISRSADETLSFAEDMGKSAKKGSVFALIGELGSGKTVFAKGIARGIGITDEITSPTFTLMEVYDGRVTLYHFDLYRIENPAELDQLFFEEYWEGDGVSVIEWADRAIDRIPEDSVLIYLQHVDESSRRIRIEHPRH